MNRRQLLPLLCLAFPLTVAGRLYEKPPDWDDSLDAYVPYPPNVAALIDANVQPVMLEIFSEVDNGEEQFFNILKGVVRRNQPVLTNTHPVIQDGVDVGCRRVISNTTMETLEVGTEECNQHCTNHGRYCSHPEDSRMQGGEHVKEAARRMCFFYITHVQGTSLLWEYLDIFEKNNCNHYDHERHLEQCSYDAIDQLEELSREQMQVCLEQTGGFTEDKPNTALSQQLQQQEKHNINPNAVARHPSIEVNGKKYEGRYYTEDIFQFVCAAFPDQSKPFACEFCLGCADVRRCLWQMTCDGTPPSIADYTDHLGIDELPEDASTTITTTAPETPEAEIIDANADKSSGDSNSSWMPAFFGGIAIGFVVAAFFAFTVRRNRRKFEEQIQKNRVKYSDDSNSSNMDFSSRNVVRDDSLDVKGHGLAMMAPYTDSTQIAKSFIEGGGSARNLEYKKTGRSGSYRTLGFKGGRGMSMPQSGRSSSGRSLTATPGNQPAGQSNQGSAPSSSGGDDDDDWDKEIPGIVIV